MKRHMDYVARNVPRYTSYPTAPHFTGDVDGATSAAWLEQAPVEATVSLYLHVPFCRAICHYCGCHTKAARRDEPISAYAARLGREIELVLLHLGTGRKLVHVHWGGGTPSILPESDFLALVDQIHAGFDCSPGMEHAIELDPRTITPRLARTLNGAGVNRVSLGMQDFNPEVQLAIGRWQPYEDVVRAVTRLDEAGLERISFDLMYGLPHQGEREITLNAARAGSLWPDRMAVFGYAHVPWMKSHQRRINTAALPGAAERLEQAELPAVSAPDTGNIELLRLFATPEQRRDTSEEAGRHARHSMVIVPFDAPGVEVVRDLAIMGHHSPEGHCEVVFRNARVPADNLLGGEGDGFALAQARLGPGRVHHCMCTIGQCELALERAAWLMDNARQQAAHVHVPAIKVVAANLQTRVADRAIQVFGAMGLTDDTPLAYLWSWGRALRFIDGPDEVHRRVVARSELKRAKSSLGRAADYLAATMPSY